MTFVGSAWSFLWTNFLDLLLLIVHFCYDLGLDIANLCRQHAKLRSKNRENDQGAALLFPEHVAFAVDSGLMNSALIINVICSCATLGINTVTIYDKVRLCREKS